MPLRPKDARESLRVKADFVVVVTGFLCDLLHGYLGHGVFHFFHYLKVLVDFAVSLVHVDDNVKVVRSAVSLCELCQEHVLENTQHDRTVDAFLFLEILECVNQSDFLVFVFCHFDIFVCIIILSVTAP